MTCTWEEIRDGFVKPRRPDLDDQHAGEVASMLIASLGSEAFWRDAATGEIKSAISDDDFRKAAAEDS